MAKQPPPPEEYPFILIDIDCDGLICDSTCKNGIMTIMASSFEEALVKFIKQGISISIAYNPLEYNDNEYDILPSGYYIVTDVHMGQVALEPDSDDDDVVYKFPMRKFLDILDQTYCKDEGCQQTRLYPCLLEGQETPPICINES